MRGFKVIKIILMVLVFFSIASAVVMYLWNWLMPELFGLPEIDLLKAAGILFLSKLLFGGFHKNHSGHNSPPWKKKWQNMPEEKKQKWKQQFASKWCSPQPDQENEKTETEQKEDL